MDMKFVVSETTMATALGLLIGISAGVAVVMWAFDRARESVFSAL